MIIYDMHRRGFTIVELIVVISIMGILLTLGVVNLRGSQANARDAERKIDIDTIALHLETYYNSGNNVISNPGKYPSTAMNLSNIRNYLRDIDTQSIMAPGITDINVTFKAATNNLQTPVSVLPQPTFDNYIYQPIQSNGDLCTLDSQDCRKYNLYYRLEADSTVYMKASKKQ